MDRIVVDTNVLIGALLGGAGFNRRVVRLCLEGRLQPVIGPPLFLEYEDVFSRSDLFRNSPLSRQEREELLAAFLSVCEWVQVYFSWRPNLPDEADDHLVELGVAAGATTIVTNNVRDFEGAELRFPDLRIMTPRQLSEEFP